MRYILDDSGYIHSVSCTPFNCADKSCTEYTGAIPSGYDTLQEWACNANIRAYKLVGGNLTFDAAKAAELQAEWQRTQGMGTILYEDGAGNYQNITLSDNAANYSYMEIYYKNDDGQYGYQKVYDPNGKTTFGTVIRKNSGDTNIMINSALFNISEEVITITRNSQANIYFSGKSNSDSNKIYITKVVGYRI